MVTDPAKGQATDVGGRPRFACAIGNFDGVHLGHQHLLQKTRELAASLDARTGGVLFEPHPQRFFQPAGPPFFLTSAAQRDELLRKHGADDIFSIPFNKALSTLSPEEFVQSVLIDQLGLAGILTGVDFRFGAGRAGNTQTLKEIGEGAGLKVVTSHLLERPDTEKFGSSGVRAALRAGNVREAAAQLGRFWVIRKPVITGQKIGRTIGFPTANFVLGELVEPRHGVYATQVTIDGTTHQSVSNFGRRPTVGADAPLLETHIFDFDGDLYGREIDVAFIEFIRDEKKFDGIAPLKAQIAKDCIRAREILSAVVAV